MGLISFIPYITISLLTIADSNHAYTYSKLAVPKAPGTVVPQPYSINTSDTYYTIDHKVFKIDNQLVNTCEIVQKAIDRYIEHGLIFDDRNGFKLPIQDTSNEYLGKIEKLVVKNYDHGQQFDCESIPHENMEESYRIDIRPLDMNSNDNALKESNEFGTFLTSNTSWGIIRGLETFSQLVYNINLGPNHDGQSPKFAINNTVVFDRPRFSFRGLMIDTARHYISMESLMKNLDAMAYNKYNVFHWHMIDDQSFPFVSRQFKNLSELAAFTPSMVYTHHDIKTIIEYANERGIRVLPEFDTPGHTYGMRFIPNLLTQCFDEQTHKPNGDSGPIDPTRIQSYMFLRKLIDEITTLFNDFSFHAGGDEVDMSCWRSNPTISDWMKSRNMTSYVDLNSYYMDRLLNIVQYYNRTPIVWQEVYDTGVKISPNVVVHIWKYMNDPALYYSELDSVTKAGYRTIFSSCWYLNIISYGQDWVKYYQCDPHNFNGSQTQFDLIEGGEACMWSEFVDEINLTPRLWPRASTVAERLWSARDVNNVDKFMPRLEQLRCRMRNRHIEAEPIIGPGYCP